MRNRAVLAHIAAAQILTLILVAKMQAADAPVATRPGEEVMRTTQHGLRATPELVRGISRMFVWESNPTRNLGLTDAQQEQMTDVMTRRFTESARSHGQQWQDLVEYTMECEMAHGGNHYNATTGPEFARRYLACSSEMHRLTHQIAEDCREFLTPEQFQMVQKHERLIESATDGIERRMKRWAKGEIGKDRQPFRPDEDPAKTPEQRKQEQLEEQRLWAEYEANRAVSNLMPAGWRPFMVRTATFFGFTEDQNKQAEKIWAEDASRVEQVMTPEWKAKVKRNRLRLHAVPNSVKAPMIYRMTREYEDLIQPVIAISGEFRDRIIALATDEQRASVVARLEAGAKRHGIRPEEMKAVEALFQQSAGQAR